MKTYNFEISEIANKFGANVQESTSERSGYPSNLASCIMVFDTLDEAEQAAKELREMINDSDYSVEVQHFTKRDGWHLWYRTGNNAYEMYDMSSELRDDQMAWSSAEAEAYLDERAERLADGDDYLEYLGVDRETYDANTQKVYNAIKNLKSNQLIITDSSCYDGYMDMMEKSAMAYHDDVWTYAIGISIVRF